MKSSGILWECENLIYLTMNRDHSVDATLASTNTVKLFSKERVQDSRIRSSSAPAGSSTPPVPEHRTEMQTIKKENSITNSINHQ